MAKPMLVTLPLIFLFMDYWPLNRFSFRAFEIRCPVRRRRKRSESPGRGERNVKKPQRIKPQSPAAPDRRHCSCGSSAKKSPCLSLSVVSSGITFYAQQKGGAVAPIRKCPDREDRECPRLLCGVPVENDLARRPGGLLPVPSFLIPFCSPGCCPVHRGGHLFCDQDSTGLPLCRFGWIWYVVSLVPVIGLIKVGVRTSQTGIPTSR